MPEGHTLHRLALELDGEFGRSVPRVSSPQGRFAESAALLNGREVIAFSAYGKHLFGEFDDDAWLHVHLGLIGKFSFSTLAEPRGAVRLRLATDEIAADLRGPQICQLLTGAEVAAQQAKLGPDPLRADADPERAWKKIQRSDRPIAALLMDQSVLAGVGNVYRAEVLFRQRINPFRPGKQLARKSWLAIWRDLVWLMPLGVAENRIDTVRHEHTPGVMGRDPRVDDHGGEVYAYRRHDMPCWVCGSQISTRVVEGRNLFWCGRCQRRG